MQPLIHRAEVRGLSQPQTLKVVAIEDFLRLGLPPQRCALMLDRAPETQRRRLSQMSWGAVVTSNLNGELGGGPAICLEVASSVCPSDIIEVVPGRAYIRRLYRRGDVGNILFATERCNSYCLMCSQPPRDVLDDWRVQQNLELIDLIDKDEPSLGITGGEPTLLGQGLQTIINACAIKLPSTDLQVLTNGRAFAKRDVAAMLKYTSHPKLQWNVPLYADVAPVHDYIVQARGAFVETVAGLHALGRADMNIEIRIVLHKPSIPRLTALAHFIYRNLSYVKHIAFMGIEPIGFALANREALWIDPMDYQLELAESIEYLAARGMKVSIFNLPLCVMDRRLRQFAAKSISTWKNIYLPACISCEAKRLCGGFFASHSKEWASRGIHPITTTGSAI